MELTDVRPIETIIRGVLDKPCKRSGDIDFKSPNYKRTRNNDGCSDNHAYNAPSANLQCAPFWQWNRLPFVPGAFGMNVPRGPPMHRMQCPPFPPQTPRPNYRGEEWPPKNLIMNCFLDKSIGNIKSEYHRRRDLERNTQLHRRKVFELDLPFFSISTADMIELCFNSLTDFLTPSATLRVCAEQIQELYTEVELLIEKMRLKQESEDIDNEHLLDIKDSVSMVISYLGNYEEVVDTLSALL